MAKLRKKRLQVDGNQQSLDVFLSWTPVGDKEKNAAPSAGDEERLVASASMPNKATWATMDTRRVDVGGEQISDVEEDASKSAQDAGAHCDTAVSQKTSSAKPQCRSIRSWEKALKISGWTSIYRPVNNLLMYLKTKKSGSEATRETYCSILWRFCARFNVDPDSLIRMPRSRIEQMIETVIKELREKDRSLKYIRTVVDAMRTFFRVNGFEGEDELKVSPPSIPPRYRKRPEYVPTPEEALKMAEAAGSLRDKAMILLMAFSGLRVSTLLALRHKDVMDELEQDIENLCIKVYPGMKKVVQNACKGNIRYYTFTIKEAAEALKLYLEEKKRIFGSIEEDEPIFNTNYNQIEREARRTKPLSADTVRRIVKNAARKAGLKRWREVTSHSFRKTFQSFLRNQPETLRMDLRDQEFLFGHIMRGSMDNYYDWGKVEGLREKFTKMIPDPRKAADRIRQKVISPEDIEKHLQEGWIAKFVLSDGRVIVEKEF